MNIAQQLTRSPRLRRIARRIVQSLPVGSQAALVSARRLAGQNATHPPGGWEPVPGQWPTPPRIAGEPFAIVRTRLPAAGPDPAFDIELFERLNEEYADRPLVPNPLEYDDEAMAERARDRLSWVHRTIDLRGKRVLEFGCGGGFEVWLLAHHFGADAWGVDITERASWKTLADERTHLVLADLAVDRPFPEDHFDRLYSFYVFEHVTHPHAALTEIFRILKPGGLAWIAANLHRGPMASHRYKEVTFPFPHLLFDDDVFREFYRRRDMPELDAAWVNRLTWAEYEDHFARIGFRVRRTTFRETPLDEAFYGRFESVLGRYPRTDLQRDFFQVVLEKPGR
ncbi:MAG: class I SAM-dependent methyltransferase [Chloroflexota bacterium]|nr:class I SAM-dependent methyltransferase [Chloroflexota bacterium]